MVRRGPGGLEGGQVLGGAVALVRVPAEGRVAHGQTLHQAIPHHLGENGRGGHTVTASVAVHYGLMGAPQFGEGGAVEEDVVYREGEAGERPPKREGRGATNVD